MSVYIHIPFCSSICYYCDFCKFYYNKTWVNNYLESLEKEIKNNYKGELINTIYIGGGTPSCLSIDELNKLFDIIKIFKYKNIEFTIECNIDVTEDKLILFKNNGVNRISIGVQTINDNLIKTIGRNHDSQEVINKINLVKKYFNNINIDLMYALPNETMKDLKNDLNFYLSLDISHISTYSLILEPHTKLYINKTKNIDEDLDYEMYNYINKTLSENNYNHYEVSNYSKLNYESKHNLVYWNNEQYYGFGIGASGYLNNIRYDNTRNYSDYISGKIIKESHKLSINETIENEFILGLRKIIGINIDTFNNKYNLDMLKIPIVNKLLKENKLIIKDKNVKINEDYIYISNSILIEFLDYNYIEREELCEEN